MNPQWFLGIVSPLPRQDRSWFLTVTGLFTVPPSVHPPQNGLGEAGHGSDPPSLCSSTGQPSVLSPHPPVSIKACSELSFLPPALAWHLLSVAELREAGMGEAQRGHPGPGCPWPGGSLAFSRLWFPRLPMGALGSQGQVSPCSGISRTVTPSPSPCRCPAAGLHPLPATPHPTPTLAHHRALEAPCVGGLEGSQTPGLNSHFCPPCGLWAGHAARWASACPSAERGPEARPALPSPGMAALGACALSA